MRYDFTLPLLVLGTGLVSAVTIGLIAWFNSKRPPGWEDAERPSYIPKIVSEEVNADESSPEKDQG